MTTSIQRFHHSTIQHVTLFVYFVYFVVSLSASTITGTIQTTSGAAYATNALFAPLSTPLAIGNNIIASTSTNVVAAANGSFSVLLKQGNYLVTLGNLRRDSVLISVPEDTNSYNINSLITNAMTFNYSYSPMYEQRVNKGQPDGYVGLTGTVVTPAGLTASNLNLLGTVNLGTAADHSATLLVNPNSSIYVQPGGGMTFDGDVSTRAELFLHGTNSFIRFDEDAAINDSTGSKVWKFNRFNITSNNVARLGDVTNILSSVGTVPIGAIVAWDKSLTGVPALPANFVECNGQTISDAASPLNGRTIRNLNANNQFLRGNTASGGTGGSATHTHGLPPDTGAVDGVASAGGGYTEVNGNSSETPTGMPNGDHVHTLGGTTDPGSTLPPYTDMVWIMRIK